MDWVDAVLEWAGEFWGGVFFPPVLAAVLVLMFAGFLLGGALAFGVVFGVVWLVIFAAGFLAGAALDFWDRRTRRRGR